MKRKLFSRKKSVYIDKYTGEYGSATEMQSLPHLRPHRYIHVGLFYSVPRLTGPILKKFLKDNDLESLQLIKPQTKKRKQIIEPSTENIF